MSRVLVVGWDGGTWTVANALAAQGRLPVLSSLRQGAAEGVLESVPNMNSAPAWSTVATGVNPGRHGIFYFDERVPGTYGRRLINAARRTGPSLWRMASEAGKRIIVVNVPISYPAEPVNGALVSGLDTPSKSAPGFTYPQDLLARYEEQFGRYVVEPETPSLVQAGRFSEAADALARSVEGWAAVTERLMRDREWDLAFVVFTSSDTAQHFFWTDERFDVIHRVYEVQDEATGRLVDLARSQDPDVDVLIIADHGGAVNTRGPEFLPIWLEDQGFLSRLRPSLTSLALGSAFRLADRTLSRERKRALAERFPRLQQRAQSESRLAGIDWAHTSAFGDGVRDDVLVNLADREPSGTVAAGDYERFCAALAERLAGIEEAETGRPAVAAVLHRDQVYQGPFADRAPDFTIRWTIDGRQFRGFRCRSTRAAERMREAASRTPAQPGGHHPQGMFVAAGPDIMEGRVRGGLADVAPTILALLGVAVPHRLDGRPVDCLKSRVAVATGPVDEAPIDSGPASGDEEGGPYPASGYTSEQEEAVRQRLEDLGYI
jgi:predicted AlkP superfamily phosphohydrolase/phosphomutase